MRRRGWSFRHDWRTLAAIGTIHSTWNVSGGWVMSWQEPRLQMLWWTPFVWSHHSALEAFWRGVGIVSGDIIRRLVAHTVAQQLNPEVEKATAPFQFALTTRCVSYIQAMTDIDRSSCRCFRPHVESSHDGRFALVGGGQSSPSFRSPILFVCVLG